MKKAFIIIATIILAVLATIPAYAAEINSEEIIAEYDQLVAQGNYFHHKDMFFATIIDGEVAYQDITGSVWYNDDIIVRELVSVSLILESYETALANGEYFTTDASQHTVNINGVECHQKMDGTFVYDGRVLIENVEEFTGYNVLKNYIGEFYIYQIRTGNYIESLGKMNYVVMTDTYDLCYVNTDGNLICGGEVIYNCVATMDDTFTATIIYQQYGTAVTVDSDFIYVYHFGEIVDIINIHTGGHPRG